MAGGKSEALNGFDWRSSVLSRVGCRRLGASNGLLAVVVVVVINLLSCLGASRIISDMTPEVL